MNEDMLAELEELLKSDMENEDKIDELLKGLVDKGRLDTKGMNAVKGALRLLSPYKSDISSSVFGQLAAAVGYAAPVGKEVIKEVTKEVIKEVVKSPFSKDMDEVKKDLMNAAGDNSEAVQKIWAELEVEKSDPISDDPKVIALFKENVDIKKKLEVERQARLTKEFQEEASEYNNLNTKKEVFGDLLKAISENTVTPDQYKAITGVYKAADKQIGEGVLLKELGSDLASNSDTMGKIETIAKGYIAKDSKLTKDEAIAKAWVDNPVMYDEYGKEQSRLIKERG